MHFIIKISCLGHLEFLPGFSHSEDGYSLRRASHSEVNYKLMAKDKEVLTSSTDRLSINIFCNHQVFAYKKNNGEILISSSFELIFLNTKERILPNLDYFVDYVSCGLTPTSSTPFIGGLYLAPGSTIFYSDMRVSLGSELDTSSSEFLEILEGGLKERLPSSKSITLEYSGGLESSILLHSLLRTTHAESLRLIHLTDAGSGQVDDLQRVKKLAEKYSCNLTILDAEELKPFQITTCKKLRPNLPHYGLVNIGYIDYSSALLSEQDTIILNGAGGDSIFCAAPQKGLPIELLRKGNILKAARNVLDISQYSRTPLIPTIKDSIIAFRGMKSRVNNPGLFFSRSGDYDKILSSKYHDHEFSIKVPDLSNYKEISVRERHLNAAINRYEMQSSPMANYPERYFYPFLTADVLSAGLSTPSHQLLKNRIDRYSIRHTAAKRYNSNDFLYNRKGGVSGLTQRCFSHYKSEIKAFLSEGYLVRSGVVNVDNVSSLINEVAAGVTKCPNSLINLFTANIYMSHWTEYVNEF